jgi:hypothetical protein
MNRPRTEEKTFPLIVSWREHFPFDSVPWALVERHREQAKRNHDQTLERLADRGGLAPSELVAVLEDRPWHAMEPGTARDTLVAFVDAWRR